MSIKIAILASGRGSNVQSILNAIKIKRLDAIVPIVISNNANAPVLKIAADFGITNKSIDHRGLTRVEHEDKLLKTLSSLPEQIDYVVLAGYMRVLTKHFLKHFEENDYFRVINIHPSLLPAFPGATAYEDAFNYGVKLSGITVHLLDEQVDHGPILAQEAFPRHENDTLESFKERGLAVEHALYPRTLDEIAKTGIKPILQRPKSTIAT